MPVYRVLTGPTASGKTAALLACAERMPLLVISADSRQVYRGMDIGTGKASAGEQALLPHRCIDLINPDQPYSAHAFLLDAAAAFSAAESEGREVWLCGGTGLYIRTLLSDLQLGTAPRPRLRKAVAGLIAELGAAAVAAKLGLRLREDSNPVRVQRAAELACVDEQSAQEIYAKSGLTVTEAQEDSAAADSSRADEEAARAVLAKWSCAGIAVLDPGRAELAQRIEARVSGMFASGLPEEVERLRASGYGNCDVVSSGICYAEAGALLDGRLSMAEAIKRAIIRTRQYAKRQRTYFRGQGWPVMDAAQLGAWIEQGGG